MFQKALKIAQVYTLPVVISYRLENGKTASAIGAFIVLNQDGWILTAGHIIDQIMGLANDLKLYNDYVAKLSDLNSDNSLTKAQRKRKLRRLTKPENPITDYSVWWGKDGWNVQSFELNRPADIAIGQISGFKSNDISIYPEFKNPAVNFDVGENLCKLGFPFYSITPTYDDSENMFELPPGALPIPLFPIEGIFTRTIVMDDGLSSAEFVETSSPGLRGQSGGPTLDMNGRIWAMQSRTNHYPLGFSPKVPNQRNEEHQFLNVGWGTHAKTIIDLLETNI